MGNFTHQATFFTGPLLLEPGRSQILDALQPHYRNTTTAGTFFTHPLHRSFLSLSDENKEYFLALQKMIEEMAEKAHGPVVLIAHSMGNMYTLYFLNQQPQAWKDRYIKAFVSLGPPWAGVAKTLRVLTSGKRCNILCKQCQCAHVAGLHLR